MNNHKPPKPKPLTKNHKAHKVFMRFAKGLEKWLYNQRNLVITSKNEQEKKELKEIYQRQNKEILDALISLLPKQKNYDFLDTSREEIQNIPQELKEIERLQRKLIAITKTKQEKEDMIKWIQTQNKLIAMIIKLQNMQMWLQP